MFTNFFVKSSGRTSLGLRSTATLPLSLCKIFAHPKIIALNIIIMPYTLTVKLDSSKLECVDVTFGRKSGLSFSGNTDSIDLHLKVVVVEPSNALDALAVCNKYNCFPPYTHCSALLPYSWYYCISRARFLQ
jgi:hypothetical protein